MARVIEHAEGRVELTDLPDGKRRLTVRPNDSAQFVRADTWDTSYPDDLIERVLAIKGLSWLVDEIRREEDPQYVEHHLRYDIFSYVDEASVAGKRILDFGCGSGASTVALGRILPQVKEVVGIDLSASYLELATARAAHRGLSNVQFMHSPHPGALPDGLGTFDIVLMSSVYEHLLPDERRSLLPMMWSLLHPGGLLLITETPHRFWPMEGHTTGLPLINYLPDVLAGPMARRLSKRGFEDASWDELLRAGVRGATATEIMDIVAELGPATLLEPQFLGCNDRIDLWFALSGGKRFRGPKLALKVAMKAAKAVTGHQFISTLSLAIRKDR